MTQAGTYQSITFEQRGRVGIVTLNRPDRMNAWTFAMNDEIMDAIEHCNESPDFGAVIVTGAGRGFCAGADVQAFSRGLQQQGGEEAGHPDDRARRSEPLTQFLRASKPVIAAINGPAIGVGITMTLPMDIRVASEDARFSMRFVRMGVTPELASSLYLPQIAGLANALDLMLTGRTIGAEEALQMGLVTRVFPADRLLEETLAIAETIANNPSEQVVECKRLVHRHMVEQDVDAVVSNEIQAIVRSYTRPAHREAVQAFLEKREPWFNQ
jgi:enoyl-CoA hydratase/carnithine racemase